MGANIDLTGIRIKNKSKFSELWKRMVINRYLYIMLIPCITWFIIFSYIPMVGLVLAFKEFMFNKGILGSPWIGFTYFELFFSYPDSSRLILNTLFVGFIKIIVYFPFPIMLALIFEQIRNLKFKRTAQTITYLPYFLSWVVISAFTFKILSPNDGVVNQFVAMLGGEGKTFYMMEEQYFYFIMFITYLWKNIGWGSIIYLAAISGIDPTLYEAAEMDGAGRFRKIWHITITGIRPAIGIIFILSLGDLISTGYDQNFLLRTPGNMNAADILDTYVLRVGLLQGQYGFATAVGLMQGIAGFILVVVSNTLVRKYTDKEASLW